MKRSISAVCGLALLAGCTQHQNGLVEVVSTPSDREVVSVGPRRLAVVGERRSREPIEITKTQETMARRQANIARQEEAAEMEREIYTSTPATPSGRVSNSTPPPLPYINPGAPGIERPGGPTSVGERTGAAPIAAPVPGKPGYVTSPFSPNSGFIDVNGLPPGSDARDPYTGQVFKVP